MMARLSAVAVLVSLLAVMLSGFAEAPSNAGQKQQDPSWTIMVYMADDFSSSLVWQNDFNEMEAAQQAPGTNIIALVDPYGSPNSALYRIEHDPNFLDDTIVSTRIDDGGLVISGGEVNMATASTLRSFITFSMSSYRADNNVLILWGHGAGWRGLCPDGTDILSLPDFGNALSQATSTTGRTLDLIVVDSCAEATLETLWQIHDYSKYFAASQNNVPFEGLPYSIVMNGLAARPSQSVEEFASKTAEDYVLWSSMNTGESVTMGVFNLSRMEPLVEALNAVSVQSQKYEPIFHEILRTAFNNSESYEEKFSVDFGHFMLRLLQADLPLEIRYYAMESLLKGESVVEHLDKYESQDLVSGMNVDNASGFTIFAPSSAPVDVLYEDISLASTSWFGLGRLLRTDTTMAPNGPGPNVTVTSNIADLTWQEDTEISSVWVFMNLSTGLSYEKTVTVNGPVISLMGIPGHLTLATSSYQGGKLDSYKTVNITLEGSVSIVVQVSRDGLLVGDLSESYEISVTTSGGGRLTPIQLPPTGIDDSRSVLIRVPEDATVGDLVTIEIIQKSSGDIVGAKRVFVPRETTTVSVEIVGCSECPYENVVPLLLALLPGLLILAFALSMHYEKRKRKDQEK